LETVVSNQRWVHRKDRYRPAGEVIDPSRYGVEPIASDSIAKAFVETHHYSGSMPAARSRVGLYRVRGPGMGTELVGVAVFSVPMQQAVVPKWLPGLAPIEGVELGRFVLLDDVPGNGETWFLARAFRCVRAELPGVKGVVSFSDPVRRTTSDGEVVMPGHVGTIYQGLNARHVGRSKPRVLLLGGDGRVVSPRTVSKLRNEERGKEYAYRELLAMGAPERCPHEDAAAYVARALREGPFRRMRHPGNLCYTWWLADGRERRDLEARSLPALPYPRREAEVRDADLLAA
jgi:hypothetical protein